MARSSRADLLKRLCTFTNIVDNVAILAVCTPCFGDSDGVKSRLLKWFTLQLRTAKVRESRRSPA